MENSEKKPNILIIAGEPSGDARGAELIRCLKPLLNDVSFWGFGGDLMSREGVEIIRHTRELSMVGAVEIIHKLPDIIRHFRQISELARERKPLMAVLIDYPGFNLKVARRLKALSIPVVYYIIPQVWAWGKGRVKKIRKFVKKALVLFPFEEKLLRDKGIECEFVGHPLADTFQIEEFSGPAKNIAETLNIALLPGSRKHEIVNMLPVMLQAAEIIHSKRGGVFFSLAESSNIDEDLYDGILSGHQGLAIKRFRADTPGTLRRCDCAIITSGTATLEGAMLEKPMVIVYKASHITYLLFLLLSRIPFIGLVNIIAGKEVVPELLQGNLTAGKLADKLLEMAEDPERLDEIKNELRKIRISLGEKGASKRAAAAVAALYKDLYGNAR
jgi:lipid-A-disaccharide synthase